MQVDNTVKLAPEDFHRTKDLNKWYSELSASQKAQIKNLNIALELLNKNKERFYLLSEMMDRVEEQHKEQ